MSPCSGFAARNLAGVAYLAAPAFCLTDIGEHLLSRWFGEASAMPPGPSTTPLRRLTRPSESASSASTVIGGTEGSQTRRWREMDSNFQFRAR